jgi:cytochrome c-type biogenesis protein
VSQDGVVGMIEPHILFGVAMAGLLSFLSPCVLPLVPPYLAYLGGTTLDMVTGDDVRLDRAAHRRVVVAALFFVLGFTTVFVALGASASMLGQAVQAYRHQLSIAAGVVIILFGLHFLGVFRIPLLYRDVRFRASAAPASFLGAYVIGLAFAFGWTPCIGPILSAVLTTAMNEASLGRGVGLLLVYSLGLGIPFVLAAVAIRPFLGLMQMFRRYLGAVEKAMGVLLIITGLLFLTGSINWFGQWLLETFPALASVEEWLVPEGLQGDILGQPESD